MTNHIEKMAAAMWQEEARRACTNSVAERRTTKAFAVEDDALRNKWVSAAQASFDALIDAVPDLVWEIGSCDHLFSGVYEITTEGGALYIYGIEHGCRTEPNPYQVFAEGHTFDGAKTAANAHNREQVRKIWKE